MKCPNCNSEVLDDRYVFCSEGCGDAFFPPEPEPDVYCLHMDSGAAWHFRDGVNLGRCPSDGCEAGR